MSEALLNEKELASYLGVSLSTVKRLRAEGLPAIKVGKRAVRFDRQQVREWLQRRAQEGP
jgi:excisionase family DNA binding protein